MAYQDISTSALTLNHEISATRAFFQHIGDFFTSISKAMTINSTAQARFETVQRLQAKTDAELAELNIKRDEIVHHVFRDLYYI